ncbi:zf-HC2 domain-containing protein [Anaerovorax odorimutans]|uniref:zf-HC2 domain-containing protein n=1 Tax=Anaerovorax odorimutans TaxID=109327 RepID=UPI000400E675|nr:zf-HC2 domain-containing protein [Anaerovorax odorimutans]
MKCEIIKDLLPSYIDNLTSTESNLEIEEHLKTCSKCKETLELMKAEVPVEEPEYNKEKIKPFKKLNKKIVKSILLTLMICIIAVCMYLYFFGFGWKVNSEDMEIKPSYQDGLITLNFELTNGRVLNVWNSPKYKHTEDRFKHKIFTECFNSVLDDRGKYPNQYSWGINYLDEDGNVSPYVKDEFIVLYFKDKTETIYMKDVIEELNIK